MTSKSQPHLSKSNLNKNLKYTKSKAFVSPIILPGLKTFIPEECSGRQKVSTIGLNHITNPQSGQGGGRRINMDVSWLNQGGGGGGGGETGFYDQPVVVDGTSNKTHATCRGKHS